jgi:hypothetical protein
MSPAHRKLSPTEHLEVATRHLARVQAWDDPTDWSDLTTYGFYCVEACVQAAASAAGLAADKKTHWDKQDLAETLSKDFQLPDVARLLGTLNKGRKATAYGDTDFEYEEYNAEDLASEIEQYHTAVTTFLTTRGFK